MFLLFIEVRKVRFLRTVVLIEARLYNNICVGRSISEDKTEECDGEIQGHISRKPICEWGSAEQQAFCEKVHNLAVAAPPSPNMDYMCDILAL